MKLFAVVVLFLACFPVLLDCFSSGRLDYPTGIPAPSAALNAGSAGVDAPATAHPDNRGFLASTLLIPTAAPGTSHHAVTTIANTAFHLDPNQAQTPYIGLRHRLQVNSVLGGAIAVCEYLLFLAVGFAFLQKQILHRLPLQSEMVVVPVPVGPTGPVVECRVPATRIPVPPETRPRRPLVRRPVLKSSISRLGGTNNQIAPQPVTKPVQPPRPGAWIEWMSVEGKLVLYSHHTGPNGSLEWTVQFFPRREHLYYLPQYPASPSLNPLLELLFTFRPFVAKIPGPMMDEVCDRIFSISAPLPPSRPETPDASTLVDMMKPPTTPTLIRPDSASEALVASGSSDTVNVNTNLINANLVHIPHPTPPPQRPKPSSSLRTRRINPTMAFSPPLPQPIYSAGRPSIASQHLSVTCIAAAEPPLSPEQAAEILLNLQPQLVDRAGRAHEHRALRRVVDSGMELENEDAVNIAEGANPGGKDDITAEHKITEEAKLKYRDVMEEIKFKFRYGGNKHRRQMHDGDQENTEPCASSAY